MTQEVIILTTELRDILVNILGKLPSEIAGNEYSILKNAAVSEIGDKAETLAELPVDPASIAEEIPQSEALADNA